MRSKEEGYILASINYDSCSVVGTGWQGSSEAELLAPAKLVISTGVVVGEARLEAGQLGRVQETWVSVAKVYGRRATHVTGTVAGALCLRV